MVPVISFVGSSNSGKTTFITKLIPELKKRGLSVAVLKHDAHGFEIDHEGKDSWKHKRAGACTVALSSPEKFAVIKDVAVEWPPERLISAFLFDADIVVVEGYKASSFPKIEVIRAANAREPVIAVDDKNLLARVTDMEAGAGVPVFGLEDASVVADFIMERIVTPRREATVTLIADGKPVTLKPFIEDLIREAVIGMTRSLKGCSEAADIELKVRKK